MKTKHFKHKRNNSLSDPQKNILRNFDSVNPCNSEDTSLLDKMDEYLKARVDLEDAESDPALSDIKEMVRDMILDYHKKGEQNKDDEIFIRDSMQSEVRDNDLLEEIDKIKLEINNSNINEVTGDWVKDWQARKRGNGSTDSKREEIRDYIISSVKAEECEPEIRITRKWKNVFRKSLLNYVSLSAAAVAGVFILIKTLIPSYNPEQLFSSNYEPMNVVRPVTRSYSSDRSDNFAAGIDSYKNGDYKNAEIEFSNAVKNNPALEPCFFLGITQLELGNYSEAANLLTKVTNQPGEYRKDAAWYLGLVYLKTGEKEKALTCFNLLVKSQGFYRERAEKILRRLK